MTTPLRFLCVYFRVKDRLHPLFARRVLLRGEKMAVEKANEAKILSMEENKENTVDEGLALESIFLE